MFGECKRTTRHGMLEYALSMKILYWVVTLLFVILVPITSPAYEKSSP